MNEAYVEGFIKQCELRGIDPEALVKGAQTNPPPSRVSGMLRGAVTGGFQGHPPAWLMRRLPGYVPPAAEPTVESVKTDMAKSTDPAMRVGS